MTRRLLGVRRDGRLPLYRLDRIPEADFESLFVLYRRGVDVQEISIPLPKRTYGHSKMRPSDVLGGVAKLGRLWVGRWGLRPATPTQEAPTVGETLPD